MKLQLKNRTAVSYIARQGGTRSRPLLKILALMFPWAERHLQDLTASYLPGPKNWLADRLSRQFLDPHGPESTLPSASALDMGIPSNRSHGLQREHSTTSILQSLPVPELHGA